jgi:hypothetical protein
MSGNSHIEANTGTPVAGPTRSLRSSSEDNGRPDRTSRIVLFLAGNTVSSMIDAGS